MVTIRKCCLIVTISVVSTIHVRPRVPAECKAAAGAMVVSARKKAMAYTVKQVAAMSGVSVRTLHFYDETGLLKPAWYGANGYRFYEESQLLNLQQILFTGSWGSS